MSKPRSPRDLDAIDERLLNEMQDRCPPVTNPFQELGVRVGVAEEVEQLSSKYGLTDYVREGNLTIAISTAGKSPAIARRLREELTDYLGGEFPALLDVAGEVRTRVRAAKRMPDNETWQTAISPELRALCVNGRLAEAKRLMFANLGLVDRWQEETVTHG